MRFVAFVSAALALGMAMATPAFAQSRGPGFEDDGAGPQRYYTGRPPNSPREEFDRPQYRDVANEREPRYDDRDGRPRPWPSGRGLVERRPEPSYRRASQEPPQSDSYRRFWREDTDDRRRSRTSPAKPAPAPRPAVSAPPEAAPPPPRESADRGDSGPVARVAVGAGQMVISIAEYESLQNQARELQRLRGVRRDFHEDRGAHDGRDLRDHRDFRNDRPGPRQGPVEIYR